MYISHLEYCPPRSIKFGQGRYALIGHHGRTTPIPPSMLYIIIVCVNDISKRGWKVGHEKILCNLQI